MHCSVPRYCGIFGAAPAGEANGAPFSFVMIAHAEAQGGACPTTGRESLPASREAVSAGRPSPGLPMRRHLSGGDVGLRAPR